MHEHFHCFPLGDTAFQLAPREAAALNPSPRLTRALTVCAQQLRGEYSADILDCVVAFMSLTVHCRARFTTRGDLPERILAVFAEQWTRAADEKPVRLVEIPVCYGGAYGPDLLRLAEHSQQSPDSLIKAHCGQLYDAYAVGFAPGFAYLGFVPKALAAPRLRQPRRRVPAGAIGIADRQTGIYPLSSPGGWNIIGCTPLAMREGSGGSRLQVGDQVRFIAIGEAEFLSLGGQTPHFLD